MRRPWLLAVSTLLIVGFVYGAFIRTPAGPRSLRAFDADRMAALEVEMWQAYYLKENARLFRGLVTLLHEQYRYPWSKATIAGFHLARAAARFAKLRSGYDVVVPDLEQAYAIARDWTGSSFDPAAVSRAELAWWVARREPGQDTPDVVGGLIADEYALLYGVPRDRVFAAALLRARAGRLRDDGGDHADWTAVSSLLVDSYRSLHRAVNEGVDGGHASSH